MARRTDITAADTALNIRREAVRLFAQYGYAAVSMRKIASAVGVMPGALYHHFPTKQDLLMCLLSEHMEGCILHGTPIKRIAALRRLMPLPSYHPLLPFISGIILPCLKMYLSR